MTISQQQGKLNKLLKVWQKRLKLQDWTVNLKVCRGDEFSDTNTWGTCWVHNTKKFANIRVLDAVALENEPTSQEVILVHELLHILLPARNLGLDAKGDLADLRATLFEEAVDSLSFTLVEAYDQAA